MKALLHNWNIMRIIRLALGIFIVYEGINTEDWMLASLGGFFSLMPIFNIGCCGVSACNTNYSETQTDLDNTTYEEVK